ncbi:MAG: VWA domain-containing protein [Steroidobacteraceae bacterium]
MKLRRRETEVFSMSFLDCICCGFGAIILLLVMTEVNQPVQIERARVALDGQLLRLQEELHLLRGDTDQLNRELQGRVDELRAERTRLARAQGDLTTVRGEFAASRSEAAVTNIVETELVAAYQELTAEMQRLQSQPRRSAPLAASVAGIPVDSEYVVFVIDTSASMVANHWESTVQIMRETLDIYPEVKGLQVMNDQGRFMFAGGRPGQWLNDSSALRDRIRSTLPDWTPFSRSNPVPGIEQALRLFRAPGQRISIYVIGDEFTGESMQAAADSIARLNAADGKRPRARIHAIGFPEGAGMAPFTNVQFSALMRVVTAGNDGTFVGITNEKPCRAFMEVLGVPRCVSR